jgi:hypothetical protein
VVAVYVIGDVLSGLWYDGYSYLDKAISELSALGSPVRPLMMTVILRHNGLLLAFGIGLLRAARSLSAVASHAIGFAEPRRVRSPGFRRLSRTGAGQADSE